MARKSKEEALETREKILESALTMMSERPFNGVSMSGIAEKIGLSKGAVYWHFKNRSDLLVNLVESICVREYEELCVDCEVSKSLDEICDYFRNKMEKALTSERFKNIHNLLLRKHEWPPEVRAKVLSIMQDKAEQERGMIEKFLIKFRQESKIEDDISPKELSSLIFAIFYGLFLSRLNGVYVGDFLKHIDFIFCVLLKKRS